jgi:hypothetical protein
MLLILLVKYYSNNSNVIKDKFNIQKLIRQTARWATAADQDTNPYIKNLHANYAMGYLMALKEIYTESEINLYGNIDIRKLDSEILISSFFSKSYAIRFGDRFLYFTKYN